MVASTNGGTPTGTVTFTDNGVVIGVVNLVNGIATVRSTIFGGSNTIVATYSGDSIFPANSASYGIAGSTATSTVNTSVFGQQVTLTATIASATAGTTATPTGTVQFYDNGVAIGGPVTLSNGVATLNVGSLPPGTNAISVMYSGDSNYGGGNTPNAGTVTVSQAQVTVALSNTPSNGQSTLTAKLSVVAPGGGTPTGTVKFIDILTAGDGDRRE